MLAVNDLIELDWSKFYMSNFENISMIGIDDSRPPLMRKETYIDLYFMLSQKAPVD
ncbi:MAG: hypothetical protein ACI8XC_004281, partial [Gammaproteobacteria bacterium]